MNEFSCIELIQSIKELYILVKNHIPDADWPAWISAICAAITIFYSRKYYSEYALVSSKGQIQSHKGFNHYGLFVKLIKNPNPEYHIEFKKEPNYFEVSTRDGAVVRLAQTSSNKYTLKFVGAGYGSPLLECDFKIQAY